jgi:hypothetical protein
MSCTVIYGGFNPSWAAGQLERGIVDTVAKNLETNNPNKNITVVVTSWHEPTDIVVQLQQNNSDINVLCSLTDPLGPIEDKLQEIPGQVWLLGYVSQGIQLDFWAIACLNFFKQYSNEILPTKFTNLYLNYNRKPHAHRRLLIDALEKNNLIQYGCNTLGNSNYNIGDQHSDYTAYGADDVVGDVGIPNDVYSLGQLDVWQRSFINIVSETQYEYSTNVFLSEKIFKPIIGLRPFIINGSPGIYRWLKQAGFDCFEDIFPVQELNNETFEYSNRFRNHQLIVNTLNQFKDQNWMRIYTQLLPRLQRNKDFFFEYAKRQQDTITTLFRI